MRKFVFLKNKLGRIVGIFGEGKKETACSDHHMASISSLN